MRLITLFAAALWSGAALAQQQPAPDPAFLQRALTSVEQQRNNALTAQAIAEARVGGLSENLIGTNAKIKELTDELTKANAKIKELTDELTKANAKIKELTDPQPKE